MGESWEGVARLACFELWGGNGKAAHPIELPGLLGWICCTPFGHATGGGDVHYMSVCQGTGLANCARRRGRAWRIRKFGGRTSAPGPTAAFG